MRGIREQEIDVIVLNLVSKEFVRRICPETSIFRKEFRTEDYIDYVNTHLLKAKKRNMRVRLFENTLKICKKFTLTLGNNCDEKISDSNNSDHRE